MRLFRDHGIFSQICGNDFMTLKVSPPLIVTDAQIDHYVSAIEAVVGRHAWFAGLLVRTIGHCPSRLGDGLEMGKRSLRISGVGSALPEYRYPQEMLTQALKQLLGFPARESGTIRASARAYEGGHAALAYPMHRYIELATFGDTNAAWFEAAQELGERAIDNALEHAGLSRRDFTPFRCFGHGRRESLARRAIDQPHGSATRHQAHADFRRRLRRRRSGPPERRITLWPIRTKRRSARGRTCSLTVQARRSFDDEFDRDRTIR